MNIQGLGQSFTAYQPMRMSQNSGMNNGFDPTSADSVMQKDDANQDGVLTIDETPMNEYMFSQVDTDSDGQLTTSELEEMLSNAPPPMAGPPPMGGPQMTGGGMRESGGMDGGMPMMGQFDIQSILETMENDGQEDGSSGEDLTDSIFSYLDTNKDGQISQEELGAGLSQNQGNSPRQTMTSGYAAHAYRQVMESYMSTFSSAGYEDINTSRFLETTA